MTASAGITPSRIPSIEQRGYDLTVHRNGPGSTTRRPGRGFDHATSRTRPMRQRLRDLPDMDATYPHPHDHRIYGAGHDIRARQTIALAQWVMADMGGGTVADLSAGQGAIARAVSPSAILGDYAPGHPISGPIEATIDELGPVDLFICTETLEHLNAPDLVLEKIRATSQRLVCSLPQMRVNGQIDTNGEHVWQFDQADGERMLQLTGWQIDACVHVEPPDGPYNYLLWACR